MKFIKLYVLSQLVPVNIVSILLTFVLVVAKPFTALVEIELFGSVIVPELTVKPFAKVGAEYTCNVLFEPDVPKVALPETFKVYHSLFLLL